MKLNGHYTENQYPFERLRNKLHPVLGIVELLKDDSLNSREKIEMIENLGKDISLEEIVFYLKDCEQLVFNQT